MPTIPRLLALFLIGPILFLGILGNLAQGALNFMHGIRIGVHASALAPEVVIRVVVAVLFAWILTQIYFRPDEV